MHMVLPWLLAPPWVLSTGESCTRSLESEVVANLPIRVLVIVTIVFFILSCIRDPNSSNFTAPRTAPQNDAELGQTKFEPTPVVQPEPVH